jgi:hypothetical protein
MLLFIKNVNEIKGPVAELLKAHVKPEHKHEFEWDIIHFAWEMHWFGVD